MGRGPVGGRRGAARPVAAGRVPVGPAGLQPGRGPVHRVRRLRRGRAGQLRRRAHRHAAGRGRPGAGPGVAGQLGRRAPDPVAARSRPRRRRHARRPGGGHRGRAAAGRRVADRGRADPHGRGRAGQRAPRRPGLQRPAPGRAGQPRERDPGAGRAGGRRGGRPARPGHLAGEQLRHRPLPQRRRRRRDRPRRAGDRCPHPGRGRGQRPGPVHLQHRHRVGPGDRPGETYVKRHPVPLAEYVPARSFFRFFSDKVDLVRADFRAGTEIGTLDMAGTTVGDVICFEVAYDGLVRDVVDGGATMIVVQTNNATFGFSDESPQQLAMGRLRAVEFGRSVVMASTSGISAVIAPDGSLVRSSDLFTPATFVEDIAQRDGTTVAARVGVWPEVALTVLGLGAFLAVVAGGIRTRRAAR
ncbi:apolipoprotein N-acyltransferase [Klenkia terrae]|uniref:apolipoprotein N-acyltransferase n=1 Tax=Klenkia terrae TaxID=1052259 RepID=UPI00361D320F